MCACTKFDVYMCVNKFIHPSVTVCVQIMMCRRAEDVILVTLNHLDTIRTLVGNSDNHNIMLNSTIKTVVDVSLSV